MTLAIILGAVVGLVMGLTGAGGGILAVPALVFGLHLTVAEAGPIGLLAVCIAAAIGAIIGLKSKIVRYRAAILIAATGIVLVPAGVWLAQQLDTGILSAIFALVLLWVAYKNLKESRQGSSSTLPDFERPCVRDVESGRFIWTRECATRLASAGSIAGVLSGLLGVGGGFVTVPALQRYTDLEMKSVVATSLSVIALISLTGVVTSISRGHFDHAVGIPFAGGAVLGMLWGGTLSARLSPKHLKIAFAAVCTIVSVGMMVKAL